MTIGGSSPPGDTLDMKDNLSASLSSPLAPVPGLVDSSRMVTLRCWRLLVLEGPETRNMSGAITLNRSDTIAGRLLVPLTVTAYCPIQTPRILPWGMKRTRLSLGPCTSKTFIHHNECNFSQIFTDYEDSNGNISYLYSPNVRFETRQRTRLS